MRPVLLNRSRRLGCLLAVILPVALAAPTRADECSKCGTENDDKNRFCVKCGQGLSAGSQKPSKSDAARPLTLDLGSGVTMEMVLIHPGEFIMGSKKERPPHRVTITKPFYLGRTEVTQAQWRAVMGTTLRQQAAKTNWFGKVAAQGSEYPMHYLSWFDCREFCRKLAQRTGRTIRFPTEAEWEYACRAGTSSTFCFGDTDRQLGNYGWYAGNSGQERASAHPVARKKANPWGLYDMHGNVREWCSDWFGHYESKAQIDPAGPTTGTHRVLRDGSWMDDASGCRSSWRILNSPETRFLNFGFRVAASQT